MAIQNHADHPYYFQIKDCDLIECCEFTSMNCPQVSRPKQKDSDDIMDPQDALGTCLGLTLLSSKLQGAPSEISITLHEEEEIPQPPILFMYSLSGQIKMYHSFVEPWKEIDLLKEPKQVPAMAA